MVFRYSIVITLRQDSVSDFHYDEMSVSSDISELDVDSVDAAVADVTFHNKMSQLQQCELNFNTIFHNNGNYRVSRYPW